MFQVLVILLNHLKPFFFLPQKVWNLTFPPLFPGCSHSNLWCLVSGAEYSEDDVSELVEEDEEENLNKRKKGSKSIACR